MVFIDDSYLGLGPTAFNNMFSNLGAQREGWYNVTWKGQNKKLPIYMISVKHLRYNLFNTRLKPLVRQQGLVVIRPLQLSLTVKHNPIPGQQIPG